jgi:hypothetical protein
MVMNDEVGKKEENYRKNSVILYLDFDCGDDDSSFSVDAVCVH